MIVLVRLARIVVLLVLALITISFVIGLGSSGTGIVEKMVLLSLIVGCVFLASKVTALATRTQARLARR